MDCNRLGFLLRIIRSSIRFDSLALLVRGELYPGYPGSSLSSLEQLELLLPLALQQPLEHRLEQQLLLPLSLLELLELLPDAVETDWTKSFHVERSTDKDFFADKIFLVVSFKVGWLSLLANTVTCSGLERPILID